MSEFLRIPSKRTALAWMFRNIAALLLTSTIVNSQAIGQSAPITLSNVDNLGLLSETKRGARFLENGPKKNELLLYPRNGVLVVDDVHFKEVRTIPAEQVAGYRFSRDLSLISWLNDKEVFIRNEAPTTRWLWSAIWSLPARKVRVVPGCVFLTSPQEENFERSTLQKVATEL